MGDQLAGVQCAAEGVSRGSKEELTSTQVQWLCCVVRVGAARVAVKNRNEVSVVERRGVVLTSWELGDVVIK